MPIRRVFEEPEELRGHAYGPGNWEWFECFTTSDGVYAKVGMCFDKPEVVMMFWRVVKPSVAAFKDLKKVSVGACNDLAHARQKKYIVVQTSDPADVEYRKMVEFMGFDKHMVVQTSWKEV